MSEPKATDNLKYRMLVMGLVSTQLWLEVMDELQDTKIYKHTLKQQHKQIEKTMEKLLGAEFTDMYKRDEESFRILMNRLHNIAEWAATAKFEHILDLGSALKAGAIAFDIPDEELDL